MSTETYVRTRIDSEVKDQANAMLKVMGLSMSDYLRIAVQALVNEKALPFAVRVPNKTTLAAMAEADEMIKQRQARFKGSEEMFSELEK